MPNTCEATGCEAGKTVLLYVAVLHPSKISDTAAVGMVLASGPMVPLPQQQVSYVSPPTYIMYLE